MKIVRSDTAGTSGVIVAAEQSVIAQQNKMRARQWEPRIQHRSLGPLRWPCNWAKDSCWDPVLEMLGIGSLMTKGEITETVRWTIGKALKILAERVVHFVGQTIVDWCAEKLQFGCEKNFHFSRDPARFARSTTVNKVEQHRRSARNWDRRHSCYEAERSDACNEATILLVSDSSVWRRIENLR